MLSIGALASAAQGASYYERDGYYAKDDPEHKAASAWFGKGAEDLGLKGPVEPGVFRAVLEGKVPDGSGTELGRRGKDGEILHRPGRDPEEDPQHRDRGGEVRLQPCDGLPVCPGPVSFQAEGRTAAPAAPGPAGRHFRGRGGAYPEGQCWWLPKSAHKWRTQDVSLVAELAVVAPGQRLEGAAVLPGDVGSGHGGFPPGVGVQGRRSMPLFSLRPPVVQNSVNADRITQAGD